MDNISIYTMNIYIEYIYPVLSMTLNCGWEELTSKGPLFESGWG